MIALTLAYTVQNSDNCLISDTFVNRNIKIHYTISKFQDSMVICGKSNERDFIYQISRISEIATIINREIAICVKQIQENKAYAKEVSRNATKYAQTRFSETIAYEFQVFLMGLPTMEEQKQYLTEKAKEFNHINYDMAFNAFLAQYLAYEESLKGKSDNEKDNLLKVYLETYGSAFGYASKLSNNIPEYLTKEGQQQKQQSKDKYTERQTMIKSMKNDEAENVFLNVYRNKKAYLQQYHLTAKSIITPYTFIYRASIAQKTKKSKGMKKGKAYLSYNVYRHISLNSKEKWEIRKEAIKYAMGVLPYKGYALYTFLVSFSDSERMVRAIYKEKGIELPSIKVQKAS